MSKYEELSEEEQAFYFDERCRCESQQPETEEEKRRAKENKRKCREYFEKQYKMNMKK